MAKIYTALSVATITALKALTSSSTPAREDGAFYSVDANGVGSPGWYKYVASSSTAESLPDVVAPSDNVGRYFHYKGSPPSVNSFSTIAVSGQSNVVADSSSDTLTLAAGTGVTITTNASTDTVTISATSGTGNEFTALYFNPAPDITTDSDQVGIFLDETTNLLYSREQSNGAYYLLGARQRLFLLTPFPTSNPATPVDYHGLYIDGGDNDILKIRAKNSGAINTIALLNTAQQFTKTQGINTNTISFSSTPTVDLSFSNKHKITLTGNVTAFDASNLKDATYIFTIVQGGSGSYTISWASKFKFPGGTPPTLSTAVGAVDIISCVCDGTNLYCSAQLNFS